MKVLELIKNILKTSEVEIRHDLISSVSNMMNLLNDAGAKSSDYIDLLKEQFTLNTKIDFITKLLNSKKISEKELQDNFPDIVLNVAEPITTSSSYNYYYDNHSEPLQDQAAILAFINSSIFWHAKGIDIPVSFSIINIETMLALKKLVDVDPKLLYSCTFTGSWRNMFMSTTAFNEEVARYNDQHKNKPLTKNGIIDIIKTIIALDLKKIGNGVFSSLYSRLSDMITDTQRKKLLDQNPTIKSNLCEIISDGSGGIQLNAAAINSFLEDKKIEPKHKIALFNLSVLRLGYNNIVKTYDSKSKKIDVPKQELFDYLDKHIDKITKYENQKQGSQNTSFETKSLKDIIPSLKLFLYRFLGLSTRDDLKPFILKVLNLAKIDSRDTRSAYAYGNWGIGELFENCLCIILEYYKTDINIISALLECAGASNHYTNFRYDIARDIINLDVELFKKYDRLDVLMDYIYQKHADEHISDIIQKLIDNEVIFEYLLDNIDNLVESKSNTYNYSYYRYNRAQYIIAAFKSCPDAAPITMQLELNQRD